MTDYPKVYGYCDAGCKRRVVSYEEMASMGALKGVDLGDGNTSVDVMQFDYFVLINEAETYADTYMLTNVDKMLTENELYVQGYFVKMSTNMAYAVGVHFFKGEDGNFKAEVKFRLNDSEWSEMSYSKIYGFRRLPGDMYSDITGAFLAELDGLIGGGA